MTNVERYNYIYMQFCESDFCSTLYIAGIDPADFTAKVA